MAISVTCACGRTFDVPDEFAGRQGKCRCGRTVSVSACTPHPASQCEPGSSTDVHEPRPCTEPGGKERETVAKPTAKKAVYVKASWRHVCPLCGSRSTKASSERPGVFQWSRDRECLDCNAEWTPGTPLWGAILAVMMGLGLLVAWVCLLASNPKLESLAITSTRTPGRVMENLLGYGLMLVVWPLVGLGLSAYGIAVLMGKAGRTRVWQ